MKFKRRKRNQRRVFLGSTRASRVVVGALADHMFGFLMFMLELVKAVGEGADCDTRGRVCSPDQSEKSEINLKDSNSITSVLFVLFMPFVVKFPPQN